MPQYQWVSQSELEDGVAAVFEPPSSAEPAGVVTLNREVTPLLEVLSHWKERYPDHFEQQIEDTVKDVYGQAMVARVAHSQALARDPAWGQTRVTQELRSPAALTMAALGLINDDFVIASRLGGLLGTKKKAV